MHYGIPLNSREVLASCLDGNMEGSVYHVMCSVTYPKLLLIGTLVFHPSFF